MKNKLIFFIAILLVLNLFSIGIISSAETAGTTTASATAPAGTGETTLSISVPADAKEPGKVGDKIINENGKPGKPEDVTIKGGTITPNKDGGGKFVTGGLDANKADLGNKGELTSKGNEIKNMQKDSKVEVDNAGRVKKVDATAGTGGSELKINGKSSDLEFKAPEGSKIVKNKEGDNTKTYDIAISKEHAKIEKEPVRKKKEKKDEEGEDPVLRFRSDDFFTQLPDEVAQRMGFKSGVEFKGVLSYDSSRGSWLIEQGKQATIRADGVESVIMRNVEGVKDMNQERYLFFGKESFNKEDFVKNGGGAYTVLGDKTILSGSTNNLWGQPSAIIGNEKNPYLAKGYAAFIPNANSEVSYSNLATLSAAGSSEAKPQIAIKGSGIFDNDKTGYYLTPEGKLLFKEGTGVFGAYEKSSTVTGAAANSLLSTFSGGYLKSGDATKIGTPMDFLPFDANGNPISKQDMKVSFNTLDDGKVKYNVIPFEAGEKEIGKLRYNEAPVDSRGASAVPAVTPRQQAAPATPTVTQGTKFLDWFFNKDNTLVGPRVQQKMTSEQMQKLYAAARAGATPVELKNLIITNAQKNPDWDKNLNNVLTGGLMKADLEKINRKAIEMNPPPTATTPSPAQGPAIANPPSVPTQQAIQNQQNPAGWDLTRSLAKGLMINQNGEKDYPNIYNQMFDTPIGYPFNPENHKLMVLDFSAPWCGPCIQFSPTLHSLGTSRNDVKVMAVDGDANKALVDKYKVGSYPTVVVIDTQTGKEVDRFQSGTVQDINSRLDRFIRK